MFGGSKPAFGSTSSPSGFGAFGNTTATPFGQSTFGKPATTGFGATTPAFGNQSTSLFGASTQSSAGLFGAPAATPAFGQPATTQSYGFGQTTNTASLFGGNAAPVASSSLFGAPATSSAFGQPAKASTFGFGSTQQMGSTGGLFGQTASTQPTAGAGLFGQNAASTSGGLFGNTGGFGSTGGTTTGTVIKFSAVTGSDTMVKNGQSNSINTKHHCITCMKEYENKSLEELRLEDYMANRKGPQAGTSSAAGGMFGAPQQTAGGLFGAQQTATATGGMFGQQDNKPLFGATTTMGGFGNATPAFGTTSQAGTSGLFGKPLTGFGAQPATTTSAFTFNTNTNANPFGAGTKPFGAVAPQTSLFGQPATATTFGAPSTGFGFGTATTQAAPLFGAQKPATPFNMPTATNTGFGGFGATTTTTSSATLFGTKPATTGFGAPTTGFGAPATSTGFGGFGQTPAGGSLFNNSFNKPATATSFGGFGATAGNTSLGGTGLSLGGTGGSLFGNTAAKPGGLFGTTAAPSTGLFGNTGTQFGTTGGLGMNTLGSSTLGGQQTQQTSVPIHQQMMLLSQPFGDSPLFKNLAPASGKLEELLKPTNPAAQKAVMDSAKFKMSPASRNVKIKVKPISLASNPKKCLFDGLEEVDSSVEEAFTLKPSSKRLVLKPKKSINTSDQPDNSDVPARINGTSNNDFQFNNSISNEPDISTEVPTRRVSWLNTSALNREKNRENSQGRQIGGDQSVLENTVTEFRTTQSGVSKQPVVTNLTGEKRSLNAITEQQKLNTSAGNAQGSTRNEEDKENISNSSESNQSIDEQPATENRPRHPTGIISTRAGYYTIPSLDDLIPFLSTDGTCIVSNFTVGREGYGNVYFNDSFDVADLNIDENVHFRHKEVVIYPDDDNKPPIGQSLNRRAQVTLDRVWPHDKTRHEPITDPDRLAEMDYEGKLRRVCAKHDTRFLEYRPQTGSWVFKVDHFSKYGLSDSEDEDDLPVDPKKVNIKKPVEPIPQKNLKQGLGGPKDAGVIKKTLQDTNLTKTLPTAEAVNGQLNGHYQKDYMNGYDEADVHTDKYDGVFNYDEDEDDVGTTWMDYNVDNENDGPMSPSADLARQAGTNNYKVQLMKASFFIRDDDDLKSTSDIMEIGGRDTPDQTVPKGPIFRPHLQGMEPPFNTPVHPIIETPQNTPASTPYLKIDSYNGPRAAPLVIHPTTVILKQPGQVIPYKDTIMGRFNSRCLADAAIFNGRRFRVGWSPNNTFVSLTTQSISLAVPPVSDLDDLSCYLQGRDVKDRSPSIIQILKLAENNSDGFRESIEGHLEIQLKHSEFLFSTESCPQITPQVGSLEEHCEMSRALNILEDGSETIRRAQYAAQVWELLVALWGNLETTEGYDSHTHLSVICRREAFTHWLETWTNSEIISSESPKNEEHLGEILNLLARHKVAEACNIAQTHGDHFLALLLSQLSGGPLLRQLVQQQLSSWQEVDADTYINKNRLQILMLVAGVTLLSSSHGTINVCEGLDWKRALGIHLWYICQPTASITDSLILYENAFSNSDNEYAYAPEPPYSNYYLPESTEHPVRDLCFHLLKLYSTKSYPLEALLNPATHTQDVLDYRLSWLLQQTLISLGYSHSSELSSCIIHTSFASQLEAHGMWHWAVFVLMHIPNKNRREASIFEIIGRHITIDGEPEDLEQETFILDSLHIPVEWVHRAKAIRAGSEHNFEMQARHLIDGSMWNEAHQVIMEHLATEAVINGQHDYLIEYLEPLTVPDHCAKISDWLNQGQLLWDYITIDAEIQKLIVNPTNNIGYHLEQLQPQISSLCSRVKLFPCPTPKHVLCQSELAKRTATIARGLLMQSGREDVRAISRLITQLPLPEDYAQQELRLVVDGCLIGF